MSCRLHQPGETPEVEPVAWRPATSPISSESPRKPPDAAAELREQAAQLQQHYEQRVREAHAAGLREGDAAGRARAAAEVQPVLDRLARSIHEIAGFRARLRAEAETDLVQLSLAIARRVLRREIAIDPEALHGLILGALKKLQGQEIARVRVHPSHAAAPLQPPKRQSSRQAARLEPLAKRRVAAKPLSDLRQRKPRCE